MSHRQHEGLKAGLFGYKAAGILKFSRLEDFMMTKNMLSAALILFSFSGLAQAQLICHELQIEKEALAYMNYTLNISPGDRAFVGRCLEKGIKQYYAQAKITSPNLIIEQQAVKSLLQQIAQDRLAAQMKAEVFEKGLNSSDESVLDQDADTKRLNPLLDENGDTRE